MEKPKVVFPDMALQPRFARASEGQFISNTCYFLPLASDALVAALNSRVTFFYLRSVCAGLEGASGTYLRFFGQYMNDLPIAKSEMVDSSVLDDLGREAASVGAALEATISPHDRTSKTRDLQRIRDQVDLMMYQAFKLSDAEVRLIEEATA